MMRVVALVVDFNMKHSGHFHIWRDLLMMHIGPYQLHVEESIHYRNLETPSPERIKNKLVDPQCKPHVNCLITSVRLM